MNFATGTRPRRWHLAPLLGLTMSLPQGPFTVDVKVQAEVNVMVAGQQARFTARVQNAFLRTCTWTAEAGEIDDQGLFTAPTLAADTLVKVRATSQATPNAWAEATVLVLHFVKDPASVLREFLGHEGPGLTRAWTASGLPFLDPESGQRLDPRAIVATKPAPAWSGRQVLGYGLPAELRWDPEWAKADGLLLAFRDGEHLVRESVTGRAGQILKVTGRIRQASLERLERLEPGANSWLSRTQQPQMQVRGLVPFAGNAVAEAGHADGAGLGARFREPWGLTVVGQPGQEACVVADRLSHVVRAVTFDGTVRTGWGLPGQPGFQDGAGAEARFDHPTFLASACAGPTGAVAAAEGGRKFPLAFVVSDSGNHAIREVDEQGRVSTLAGTGQAGFADADDPRQAQFSDPQGLAMDAAGVIYVADRGNARIRKIDAQRRVTTLAGSAERGLRDGHGAQARFRDLRGLALDSATGLLYVLDEGRIRQVTADGEVTTLVSPGLATAVDPDPVPAEDPRATLWDPVGIVASDGLAYITERGGNCIVACRVLAAVPGGRPGCILVTSVGDAHRDGIRWGLLRDGLPGALPEGYATVTAARGLAYDRQRGLYVALGRCLGQVSEMMITAADVTQPMALKANEARARAGQPHTLTFSCGSLRFGGQAWEPSNWTARFWDPRTGEPVAAPQRGRSWGRDPVTLEVTFAQAGPVAGLLTCLTDSGVTMFVDCQLAVNP